jgi:hypothetical protein
VKPSTQWSTQQTKYFYFTAFIAQKADADHPFGHGREIYIWTTTILRADIKAEGLEAHILQELENFPREFVLFLPVNVSLELELGDGTSRIIHRDADDEAATIHEGDEKEQWLVAQVIVPITEAMRQDAGTLHGRKEIQEVPLIWAMSLDPAEEAAGEFWAFFPIDTLSRVAGIINAPWKIDFGRSALSRRSRARSPVALAGEERRLLISVVHPLCLKRQRLPRLKQLRSRLKQQPKELDICAWLPHQGSGHLVRASLRAASARHGHSRSADCVPITLAKRLR